MGQRHNLSNKPLALIVDDEKSICSTLAGVLSDEGWNSMTANSGLQALGLFKNNPIDLVLLDVWMQGLDGIQTLQKMKAIKDNIPIVVMSGHGTIETAVKATKLGAFDFLEKPLSLDKLIPMVEHAEKFRKFREQGDGKQDVTYQLIGESPAIAAIHRQIKVIAPRNSWVLITGENGTGKEVVARNIHLQSTRAERAFVAVNCAAIPEELIESELFGHAKGAFTNAIAAKRGKFELAHHGTLFLDEIGDMSLKTQAKILRILQEQRFERLGDTETIGVDVRVIAATNKDLNHEIKVGHFREDLFYRLNVIPIHLSPLRERGGDALILAQHFLQQVSMELQELPKVISPGAQSFLLSYSWPGNVRELRNLIERLSILVPGPCIDIDDLPDAMLDRADDDEDEAGSVQAWTNLSATTLKAARSLFERTFILEKLEAFGWNVSKTAEAIGVERSNLHRKLRTYGIDTKRLKL